jgi:hypothetical protein
MAQERKIKKAPQNWEEKKADKVIIKLGDFSNLIVEYFINNKPFRVDTRTSVATVVISEKNQSVTIFYKRELELKGLKHLVLKVEDLEIKGITWGKGRIEGEEVIYFAKLPLSNSSHVVIEYKADHKIIIPSLKSLRPLLDK